MHLLVGPFKIRLYDFGKKVCENDKKLNSDKIEKQITQDLKTGRESQRSM